MTQGYLKELPRTKVSDKVLRHIAFKIAKIQTMIDYNANMYHFFTKTFLLLEVLSKVNCAIPASSGISCTSISRGTTQINY